MFQAVFSAQEISQRKKVMIKMKFIFVITRCLIKMTFASMKQTNSIIQAFSNLFDYLFII